MDSERTRYARRQTDGRRSLHRSPSTAPKHQCVWHLSLCLALFASETRKDVGLCQLAAAHRRATRVLGFQPRGPRRGTADPPPQARWLFLSPGILPAQRHAPWHHRDLCPGAWYTDRNWFTPLPQYGAWGGTVFGRIASQLHVDGWKTAFADGAVGRRAPPHCTLPPGKRLLHIWARGRPL